MKNNIIIGINLGDYGSTGSIMRNSSEYANKHGDYDYLIVVPYSHGKPNTFAYEYRRNVFQKIIDRFIFLSRYKPDGFKYYFFTKRIVRVIKQKKEQYKNCIVHLHNIHHCEINLKILFTALSKMDVKIYYTFHDAWPLTGGCYYFNYVKCQQWRDGCKLSCPQKRGNRIYTTNWQLKQKKKYFNLVKDKLTIVCVSDWLKQQVANSFLKEFKTIMIHGECSMVPLNHANSALKSKLGLNNKKIVLTVSSYWNEWKGAKYIYDIAKKLPINYSILVVGGKFNCEKYSNIVHVDEIKCDILNQYYSIADVYISTSQDEALGLTTCEAQICGVPVVTFGHGGNKETISKRSGYVVGEDNNIDEFIAKIIDVCDNHPFKNEYIIKNGARFAKYVHAKKMFELYNLADN